jgi:hypothetical protein
LLLQAAPGFGALAGLQSLLFAFAVRTPRQQNLQTTYFRLGASTMII